MRSFVISVIILSLILGTSILTTRKTEAIALELLDQLNTLESKKTIEAYNEYSATWDKYQAFFDITMPKNKSIPVTDGAALIESALLSGSSADFLHGIYLTRSAIESIYESNKTNLKNIL